MMRKSVNLFAAIAMVLTPVCAHAAGVSEQQLRAHIEILASDEFAGRDPGTEGEAKTIEYIAADWAKAGLKPAAADGSWFEPVPLVRRSLGSSQLSFTQKGRKLKFADNEIVMIGRDQNYSKQRLSVMFAGHGVNADGKPVGDVSGKLVFMLLAEADFLSEEMKSAAARRDVLIDAGAEAVVLIADNEPGSWNSIRRRSALPRLELVSRDSRAAVQGAASAEYIVGLATAANRDWDKLMRNANKADFPGVDFEITADLEVSTRVERFNSHNVIGKIAGRKKGNGAVLYMGHWDHLGICRPESAEDRICNGAVDNASGLAVLSEVAKALRKKKHDRDIYFLATTAEESGLLGAYAYSEKPVFPLEDIVIALNVDTIAVAPRGAKVAIIGRGTTSLDPMIEKIAEKLGRKIERSDDANAFIRRQDGWALAQKGVPAVMVGGAFADIDLLQRFLEGDYHGPEDELTASTPLGGAAQDADLHIELGKFFANARKYRRDKTGS
ncbi:M28 family peptidase [Sphingorhabdus arenilitoris]|uniref:M28 family peptidase n=1 Tax=Sphingorhabdus arenilitoris TaxID=1490041 RepID=A0ABV8RHY9_9SPHN